MGRAPDLFKTAEGRAAYLAAYDSTLELWPVPFERRTVPTRFGATHVLSSGEPTAPPMVLLHSGGASSTIWLRTTEGLSSRFRTHAVDVIGDVGRSTPVRVPASEAEYVEWLTEVLDGLGLDRVTLVGASYGGFVSLCFALIRPERVDGLCLLAPAGCFSRLAAGFWLRMIPPGLFRTERVIRWFYGQCACCEVEEAFLRQGIVGTQTSRVLLKVAPRVFGDDELRSIEAPTVLLIGDRDFIYPDVDAALDRCRRLVAGARAHRVEGAGHMLCMDRPEAVTAATVETFCP